MAKNETKKDNQKETKKQGFSIYALFGKIGDILFIPIILISLFSSMSMLVQKRQNKPTSFFGYSLVNILSNSMKSQGFLKGDTVITKTANVDTIQLGDVIAFYNYRDPLDNNTTKNLVVKYQTSGTERSTEDPFVVHFELDIINGVQIDSVEKQERSGEKAVQDAQKAKSSVYFHQVVGIYVDDYGNVFYQTKGSSNNYLDNYIRSDFVVGEYVSTSRFLRDTMSFCSSSVGMIVLVCIPLSILVLMQCFSLIKQIETMNMEKQLILGKRHFTEQEVIEALNGNEMETHNKALLYYMTTGQERQDVLEYMWSDILDKPNLSKSNQKLLETLNEANQKLETSEGDYWQTWIDNTKGHTRKKLKQYYEDISLTSVLETNKQTTEKVVANAQKQQEVKITNEETDVANEEVAKAIISKVVAEKDAKPKTNQTKSPASQTTKTTALKASAASQTKTTKTTQNQTKNATTTKTQKASTSKTSKPLQKESAAAKPKTTTSSQKKPKTTQSKPTPKQ